MRGNWYSLWYLPIPVAEEQNGQIIGGWGEMVERTTKSMPSLTTYATTMSEEEIKPVSIDYRGVQIPAPTKKLLTALALKAWIDYSAQMELHLDHPMPQWDHLPDKLKDVWYQIARGQHGVMTLMGGGDVREIDAE